MEHRPVDHKWKGHCLKGQRGRTSKRGRGKEENLAGVQDTGIHDSNIQSEVEKVEKVEKVQSLEKGRKKEKGGKDEGIYSRARKVKETWSSLVRISQSGKVSHAHPIHKISPSSMLQCAARSSALI
ncbi:uncharacterized protein N7503_007814 [Penicillium pulvis]|uniref:uncharacterized protein n=1 Tax=Penicillium pulvis TaxID=1562058 RepID=UPI00254871F0|nr:uncharacterized protein N7503_007814 [Penicillium pulvis]KAJ5798518.1 hypothetical protein N7503_007814 [Penicillium pulvis]